ncbi:hypothetical protein ES703_122376 [subsurface metagenome]
MVARDVRDPTNSAGAQGYVDVELPVPGILFIGGALHGQNVPGAARVVRRRDHQPCDLSEYRLAYVVTRGEVSRVIHEREVLGRLVVVAVPCYGNSVRPILRLVPLEHVPDEEGATLPDIDILAAGVNDQFPRTGEGRN